MAFRFSSGDVTGFSILFCLAILYGIMSTLTYSMTRMKHIKPLEIDAPLDRFSEARAIEHVVKLSKDIDGRQEGRPGIKEAARYIKSQLEMIKGQAGSHLRIEIDENLVQGSFNMKVLGHSISLGYRNHTNIVMRISSVDSQETEPSVLVNGHFDSPLGSPGAGDCGSCVATMLEMARLTVDSGWVPPQPIIFLFNGAEELFMLGAHGFMKTHKWRHRIAAFINIEASGTGGPDLVCQSGPGSWPSRVYAQAAIYPMAHSAAQDIFPVIPGDTDYRIFAEDYGSIPGLDIIFLLGGYYYHTSYDTVERLLPGSIQARGDNLFSLIKAFTYSTELQISTSFNGSKDERAVFFDYLSLFVIYYSKKEAVVLHSIPVIIFILAPLFLRLPSVGFSTSLATFFDFMKGMLFHAIGVILAVILPVSFAILRLLFSSDAMSWFAHPFLAFMMFIPSSLIGLLIPRTLWRSFPLSQDVSVLNSSKEVLLHEARFWGTFGFYALLTLAYLVSGLSGGFLTFALSASVLLAWISFYISAKVFGCQSIRSSVCYVVPLIPCLTYSVYFGGFLVQFLIERMGMMGSLPPPYGYFVQDIVVAAIIGVVTGWCVGPLIPAFGHYLARASILQFLLQLSILAMAISSQFFPYTMAAPKRVVFQHTFRTADAMQIVDCSYDFSVVDSNSLGFLLKNAPEVAKELDFVSEMSFNSTNQSSRETWMALLPVSFMFSRRLKFPARSDDMLKHYRYFPHISAHDKPHTVSYEGSRRVHLELSLGSLEEIWVAVLNITGPLSSWSFADNKLPEPETHDGGPPSYICRLSGTSHENWTFWLEASSSEALRVEVAVLDQYLVAEAQKLKSLFPNWVDVIAYSSFMSTFIF